MGVLLRTADGVTALLVDRVPGDRDDQLTVLELAAAHVAPHSFLLMPSIHEIASATPVPVA